MRSLPVLWHQCGIEDFSGSDTDTSAVNEGRQHEASTTSTAQQSTAQHRIPTGGSEAADELHVTKYSDDRLKITVEELRLKF